VKAVARNGNLLLDVGPYANGELDPQAVKILKEIGKWLKINGEAIYDTRPVKPYELGNVFFTGKADGTVYAIVLSSQDGESMPPSVILPASLTADAKAITLVGGDGTALAFKPGSHPDTTEVSLPTAGSIQMTGTDAWSLKIVK
ncbi:MAG: alpha-L-fucosidase, partial [Planctomycetes bacterium]|nr:alpha-L-fucosidase [Planctomycetota bacterium]